MFVTGTAVFLEDFDCGSGAGNVVCFVEHATLPNVAGRCFNQFKSN
jgi:hypothetical protein